MFQLSGVYREHLQCFVGLQNFQTLNTRIMRLLGGPDSGRHPKSESSDRFPPILMFQIAQSRSSLYTLGPQ